MVKKVHPHNYWTKERCAKELAKYTRKLDAKYGSPSAYNSAYNHGWLDEIAPHLQSKTYWNREKCFALVKEKGYKTKKEFREDCIGGYDYAKKHGFLDELCDGMEVLGNYNLRKIYAFEFDDGYAYVGLTFNTTRRKWQHLNEKHSPVYKHIEATHSKYTFKVLTGWLKMKAAQKAEEHMINEYAHRGWKMLNTKKGGALGSARKPKYTLEELIEEAKKYKKRSEFRKHCPAKYGFAYAHGLLDIVCANMPQHYYSHAIIWTEERLDELVKECGYSRQTLKERYPLALEAIQRKDLVQHYFGNKRKAGKIRTLDNAMRECAKYKSIQELKKKDSTLYEYVAHKGWADACFKHMDGRKPKMVDRISLTWDDILDKIKRCSTLKEFRITYPAYYRTALRNPEWRSLLLQMLPQRNKKTLEEVRQVCLQYNSPVELQKANLHIYNIVLRKHWQKACFAHMKTYRPIRQPYTWNEILETIKLCKRLKDFTERFPCEYRAALKQPEWKKKLYQILPSNKKSSNV